MHHLRKAGFAAALAVTFVMGGFILPDRMGGPGAGLFRDVLALVSTSYIDPLDISEVYERAAEGLVLSLGDPYAELYSPADLEEFTAAYEGHYAGVGMLIESQRGVAVVRRVYPNTPAERHGVQMGDRIRAIDGEAVDGWPLERVANALKGEPGSLVDVEFERYGVTQALATRITRAVVRIPAVPFAVVMVGDIGYIPLQQFNETAATEVAAAVRELWQAGARAAVLDLRGNGGGMVGPAVEVAGLFLPEGVPVARQWDRAGEDIEYRNEVGPLAPDLPLVVLVDGGSASASEIVAGALQDHDRAVVVGTTSFGKGLVQTAYGVEGGYVLKMTTGKWYTPSGRSIHRERALVRGRLVEVDDSVHFGAAREERPVYRSGAGRLLHGGGGILPDVESEPPEPEEAELALLASILPVSPEFSSVIFEYATEVKDRVTRDFVVTQEWRDEVYRRLADRGVGVEREVYDAGATYIDWILEDWVGRLAFGEGYSMLRHIDSDPPLQRAIEVIRGGGAEQAGLFGYVEQLSAAASVAR